MLLDPLFCCCGGGGGGVAFFSSVAPLDLLLFPKIAILGEIMIVVIRPRLGAVGPGGAG